LEERRELVISAVVVTYESASCIERCLASLREHLPTAELVVVDNASMDASADLARAAGARVIELPRNVGFGRASNTGVAAASGEHILFVNPDVTLVSVGHEALRESLERRPFGLVPGKLIDSSGTLRHDRRLPEPSFLADFLTHTVGMLRPRGLRLPQRPRRQSSAGWASAALLLAARDEFERLGGFDPRFFLYYEDRDLAARYRAECLPLDVTDALVGVHLGGGSSEGDPLRVEPMGWAFLSWLEYEYIHRGERVTRVGAAAAWRTLRTIESALSLSASFAPRAGRIARKRRQLDGLMAFLRERALTRDDFCPEARSALARVLD
jgi:N-acetylglucosaminyl-diphospho-decaprenol L-rhamnosyltransferase